MHDMLAQISDGAWAALGVIATAVAAVITGVITNRSQQNKTRQQLATAAETNSMQIAAAVESNSADHGTVARALSALTEEVKENHRRNGERFERLGQRVGDLAVRQETMMTTVNERIDHVGERIDDVISSQRDHLQHHLDSH